MSVISICSATCTIICWMEDYWQRGAEDRASTYMNSFTKALLHMYDVDKDVNGVESLEDVTDQYLV